MRVGVVCLFCLFYISLLVCLHFPTIATNVEDHNDHCYSLQHTSWEVNQIFAEFVRVPVQSLLFKKKAHQQFHILRVCLYVCAADMCRC